MVADLAPPELLSPADTALLAANLTTGDPEGQTARLRIATTDAPEIVQRYSVAPPKNEERPYVWCAHCGKPTHWKGYVVRLIAGELVNLGHECGGKQFGFEFGTVENEFNALVDRQALLRRLLTIRQVAPEVRKLAHKLSLAEETLAFDEVRASLLRAWPVVWRALRSASGSARLVTQVVVADPEEATRQKKSIRRYHELQMETAPTRTARERLRKEMQAALAAVGDVTREVTTDHGALAGSPFLQLQGTLEAGWQGIQRQAQRVCEGAETGTGSLSTGALRHLAREADELLDAAARLAVHHGASEMFWQAANLQRIVRWWSASGETWPSLKVTAEGVADEAGAVVSPGPARQVPEEVARFAALRASLDARQ